MPAAGGATHRYIGASPGCWAVFGEVLAREYGVFRDAGAGSLAVDAYAAQHPGTPSPQSIQSVAVHLMGLYLALEDGDHRAGLRDRAVQIAAIPKRAFTWLEPPESLGDITVLDVHRAADRAEHLERVERWARSVWNAWTPHHPTVRRWAERHGLIPPRTGRARNSKRTPSS